MAYPFKTMPTLREFIYSAVQQGCKEGRVRGIIGARGPAKAHYLVGPGPKGAIAILPNIGDSVRLTPTVLSSLVRILGVEGYEDSVIDDSKTHTYVEDEEPGEDDQPRH